MFKNKKIVAMVLCALMLFVPVAAMAADPYNGDLLWAYRVSSENANKEASALAGLAAAYKTKLETLAKNPSEKAKGAADEALKAFNKQVEKANKAIAVAEADKYNVDGSTVNEETGWKAFRQDNTGKVNVKGFACRNEVEAKGYYTTANEFVSSAKQAVKDAEATVRELDDVDKIAQAALERALKMAADSKTLAEAEAALDLVASVYDGMDKAYKDIAAPYVQKVWDKYASFATFYQKNAKFRTLSKDVQKLLGDVNKKDYVPSKEGWRVVNKNEGDYLKDVAKVEVVTKDGKSTVKLYDAAGKELKLDRSLYIWIPVAKDTKVLGAKVDGKETTFSVFTVDNQKYVEVAAEF